MKQADLFNVQGHVALVTGAASGLGLAFAEVMAKNGALVVLTDIDAAGLDQSTARLRTGGCRVEQAVVDISDGEALRAAIDGAAARHGRLDAVFANAGMRANRQLSRGRDAGDFGRGAGAAKPAMWGIGGERQRTHRPKHRVPSGCGENGRRVRRKARPYSRYALHLSPAPAAIFARNAAHAIIVDWP